MHISGNIISCLKLRLFEKYPIYPKPNGFFNNCLIPSYQYKILPFNVLELIVIFKSLVMSRFIKSCKIINTATTPVKPITKYFNGIFFLRSKKHILTSIKTKTLRLPVIKMPAISMISSM